MIEMGVPEAAAKEAVRKKAATLEIEAHSVNYDYLPSVARHLQSSRHESQDIYLLGDSLLMEPI
jgi:hypothetical protein